MASDLVDPGELRDVLGLGNSSLYPDTSPVFDRIAAAAGDYLEGYLDADTLAAVNAEPPDPPAAVSEAALAIAVELWQHRVAAGGEVQAADWTPPSPYRLGRSLLTKVQGLIANHLDTGGLIG